MRNDFGNRPYKPRFPYSSTEKKQETPLVSNTSAEGKIEKIMIFYRDGTFKEYSKR